MEEDYFVYILECDDGSLYTGIAKNLKERLKKHMKGDGAKYTKSHGFKKLVYFERQPNRSQATKREINIKSKDRQEKKLLIERFNEHIGLL